MNAKRHSPSDHNAPVESLQVQSLRVAATPPRIARAAMGLAAIIAIAWRPLTPPCHAEDLAASVPSTALPPDATSAPNTSASSDDTRLTREQWQRRIEAARERLRQRRIDGLGLRPAAPTARARDRDNTERAMSDDSLQPGDMVSTPKGLMTFKGLNSQSGESREDGELPPKPERNFVPAVR